MGCSQAVRPPALNRICVGSNPTIPAKIIGRLISKNEELYYVTKILQVYYKACNIFLTQINKEQIIYNTKIKPCTSVKFEIELRNKIS